MPGVRVAWYTGTLFAGYLLMLTAGIWIWRLLRHDLLDDVFNDENESFMQETRLLSDEYSVNLPTLIRQIEIKKKSIENAERTYEINLEKYRNGNLTGMDLQQFQNQLTTAKQDYTSAIISYKIELLNLKIQTLWDFETHKSYLPVDLLK